MTVLGGQQVDRAGRLANWMILGRMVPGMGGAMIRPPDLVVTELAIIAFPNCKRHLSRPGISVAQVIAATEAELVVPTNVPGKQL